MPVRSIFNTFLVKTVMQPSFYHCCLVIIKRASSSTRKMHLKRSLLTFFWRGSLRACPHIRPHVAAASSVFAPVTTTTICIARFPLHGHAATEIISTEHARNTSIRLAQGGVKVFIQVQCIFLTKTLLCIHHRYSNNI